MNLAVLISGGLDSAILLGDALRRQPIVPIYMRCGLSWETVELQYLRRFSCGARRALLSSRLSFLDQPIADVYGDHWSLTGEAPLIGTPEEAVFLPGRNVAAVGEVAAVVPSTRRAGDRAGFAANESIPRCDAGVLSRVPGNRQSRGGRSCQSAAAFRRHEKGRRDGAGKGIAVGAHVLVRCTEGRLALGEVAANAANVAMPFADARMVDPTVYPPFVKTILLRLAPADLPRDRAAIGGR